MHVLYILLYVKRNFWAKATSNSENIKPKAPAVIKLHLFEGISK